MVQFMSVSPSEYHPRYSPFKTEFVTVTFFECQNASFVSKLQLDNLAFFTY